MKEEETREFRHDISNHIMCLKDIIICKNLDEASKYIDQMYAVIMQINKKNYFTGNEIIDAILNYHVHQLIEGTEVFVAGICNESLDVNNIELCSIVSNPVQNAINALNNQKLGKRYLKIQINSTQHNFKMVICNSFSAVG